MAKRWRETTGGHHGLSGYWPHRGSSPASGAEEPGLGAASTARTALVPGLGLCGVGSGGEAVGCSVPAVAVNGDAVDDEGVAEQVQVLAGVAEAVGST
jgi:hypothetical protein